MIGDFQVFFHMATDSAPHPLIRFLSSSAPTKIFTARVKNSGRNFPFYEKIHPEFQTKASNLESKFFIKIKFEKVRQIKTGKDNNNYANRCF